MIKSIKERFKKKIMSILVTNIPTRFISVQFTWIIRRCHKS